MKIFKTCAKDKKTKQCVFIESEYPTKANFIKDMRCNGYYINPLRVKEKVVYDYILDNTDANDDDFKRIKNIPKKVI